MFEHPPTFYPALRYQDAPAALDWLQRAFGFEKIMEVTNPDGTIAHAEMSFGSGVIMLGSSKDDLGEKSPLTLQGVSGGIYVYLPDPDGHCERARAAGATIVAEPYDTDYESREYSAKDLEGHHWSFGTYHPG